MPKLRMFSNLNQSAYIPPIWLAILLAWTFVFLGSLLGELSLFPIGILLELVSGLLGSTEGAVFEFFYHYMLFFQLGLFFLIALLVFLWVRLVEKRPFASLGFFKKNWYLELGGGFLLGFAQFSVVVAFLLLTGAARLELAQLTMEPFLFIVALIPFWILQGGTEELVTRGWLFPVVSKKSNVLVGAIISSLLFAFMHLQNQNVSILAILNIFLVGLFACLMVIRFDNLWILAGWHGAWNFTQGNIYGIQVSGQEASSSVFNYFPQSSVDWLTGGEFGAEGSLLTSLFLFVSLLFLYMSLKKSGKFSLKNNEI